MVISMEIQLQLGIQVMLYSILAMQRRALYPLLYPKNSISVIEQQAPRYSSARLDESAAAALKSILARSIARKMLIINSFCLFLQF